ncbi:acyl-CoA thioesterase FadM [Chitinophaga skermanii]|uniref:Acyl-CoA thioesterase FadM n=1 Tax=Chitinophaga skermanii TaxID=331697 RepID=A0A327Q7H9_9BACT|nr:thioesterase family protein [Chitinophaga skermanii]RAI99823.1 acyl-CoA thioesterase FadM [Chitinophaga skermanii]
MARIKLSLPAQFNFNTHIPVRISDVNYGGHVGNDAILSMMHDARVQYLHHLGATELQAFGTGLIMADVAIIYKNESFQGDVLLFEVTADEFTPFGFDLYYRVSTVRQEKHLLIAEGKTGMVCYDYAAKKVAKVPAELQQKLQGVPSL